MKFENHPKLATQGSMAKSSGLLLDDNYPEDGSVMSPDSSHSP